MPLLEVLLPDLHAQIVNVLSDATLSRALIGQAGRWRAEHATAMICRDLENVPHVPPPVGVSIRAVSRVEDDPVDGVPLDRAAQACLRADPSTAGFPLPGFIAFLKSLPRVTQLLAGVDNQNAVHATAGSSVVNGDASAYFVSTDPIWRGRGVATSMTAAALRWAHGAGARVASLDASAEGWSIYRRLGFEPVSPTTLFVRFG